MKEEGAAGEAPKNVQAVARVQVTLEVVIGPFSGKENFNHLAALAAREARENVDTMLSKAKSSGIRRAHEVPTVTSIVLHEERR